MRGLRVQVGVLLAAVPLALALLLTGPAVGAASAGDPSSAGGGGIVTPFVGQVQVPAGATMTEDLQMVAGEVRVDGTLQGAVAMAAGQISVGPHGVITGGVTLGFGQVTVEPGGRIQGSVTVGGSSAAPLQCPSDQATPCTLVSAPGHGSTSSKLPISGMTLPALQHLWRWPLWWHTAFHLLGWVGLLALSLPVAALFPRALGGIVGQMEGEPGRTALIGLCAMVLALPVLLLVAVTIIGIPVAIAAVLGLVVAWFFGYVGVIVLVGRQTLRLGGILVPNPLVAVVVGSVLVAVAEWVPILGGLVWLAVGCLGLGAVLLTRFGTGSQWPRGGGATPPQPSA